MIRNIFSEYMKINNACQCVMMTTVIMASVVVDTQPIIESIRMCLPQSKIQTILVYTPTAYIYVYTYIYYHETPNWLGVMVRLLYRPAH